MVRGSDLENEPQGCPGTYALILSSAADRTLPVGRLGALRLRPGFYLYIGSALGPGALRARIAYHSRPVAHPHWHVDYLRKAARLEEVWCAYSPVRREHQWAGVAESLAGASIPIRGFGTSDCHCRSHLYFFRLLPSRSDFCRRLRAAFPGHEPVSAYRRGRI